jgi:hypothetical protein
VIKLKYTKGEEIEGTERRKTDYEEEEKGEEREDALKSVKFNGSEEGSS